MMDTFDVNDWDHLNAIEFMAIYQYMKWQMQTLNDEKEALAKAMNDMLMRFHEINEYQEED